MKTHVSADELARFRGGNLSADELLAIDDHLAACEQCRAQLRNATLQQATEGWEFALQSDEVRTPKRRWMAIAVAAAAAAMLIVLLMMPRGTEPVPPPRGTISTPRPAPNVNDVLRDGERMYKVDRGQVLGLRPDLQTVADQILDGTLPSVHEVRRLSPPVGAMRGSDESDDAIRLRSPVGVVVEDDRPLFVWTHPPGTDWSRVEVFDTTLRRVAASERSSRTQWRPSEPLARGATYLWQVRGSRGDVVLTAPAPPLAPVRFKVVSAAAAKELDAARTSGSRLILALLYAREGELAAARAQLEALAAENPHHELPRKLANALP
jgi:hypothetical protein